MTLLHIPGDEGWPVVGHTFEFIANPLALAERLNTRYGSLARGKLVMGVRLFATSAEANEAILLDRGHDFSAQQGWHPILGRLFPRGLMLRDGDDHRYHRRLMQPAFRKEALAVYLARMQPRITAHLAQWQRRGASLKLYPLIKQMTLDIAAEVFLGLTPGPQLEQVNRDFADVVEASIAVVRLPVLGRKFAKGIAARERLAGFLTAMLAHKRRSADTDLFAQLCRVEDEHGQRYSDSEIVDHMIFIMMAAHDTTTSALTTIAYGLSRHPEWQEQLRADSRHLQCGMLEYDHLPNLPRMDWVLKESLRLYPPLTTIVRRSVREVTLLGYRIPADTGIALFPVFTQRQPRWWTQPEQFDPERFSPERAEHRRHPFAWTPFGGGAHMCLGLHFAELQVKAVLHQLLQRFQIGSEENYRTSFQMAPIVKPRDGLQVQLRLAA